MTNIIKMGTIPEKTAPWYENTTIHCDFCGSVFMIDADDLHEGHWVERQERTLDGKHTVEGNCPVCMKPMLIDVRALLKITEHGPPVDERNHRSDHDAALMSRGYREGGAGDDTT